MHKRTQGAMTLHHYGCLGLFITFACNWKWIEIMQELLLGQKPQNQHEIVARVFCQKIVKLMDLIIKGNTFEET